MADDGSSACATIPQDRYEYDDDSTSAPTFASDQGGGLSVVFGQESEFEESAAGFNEYATFTEDEDDEDDYTEDYTENIDGTSTQETNSVDDGHSTFTDDYSEMMLLEDDFDLGLLSTAFTSTNSTSLWVDSACSWLEQPMCLLGGTENNQASLLRQSKGRTRAALGQIRLSDALSQSGLRLSQSGLTAIAMERRSLRLNRPGTGMSASGSVTASQSNVGDDAPVATDGAPAGSVLTMTEDHIQLAGKQNKGDTHGSKRNTPQKLEVVIENDEGDCEEQGEEHDEHEEIQSCKDAEGNDSPASQEGSRLSPINLQTISDAVADNNGKSEDVQEISSADNKNGDIHHDEDSFGKDSYRLRSSPSPMETRENVVKMTVTTPSQPLNVNSEDLSESESIESDADSTAPQVTDRSRVPILSKRSESPVPTNEHKIETEEVRNLTNLAEKPLEPTQNLSSAPSASASAKEDTLAETPQNQVPNGVEVIDLQGIEEQQEWASHPGTEAKLSSHSRRKSKIDLQELPKEEVFSPSFADRRALFDQKGDTSSTSKAPSTLSNTSVNDLVMEEEANISAKKSKRPHNSHVGATARLTNPETVDDLWNEEENKLHIIPHRTDIFDDPDAREAFLGHRRGQLQEVGFRNEEHLRSTSRSRHLFDSAFEKSNREAVKMLGSKNSNSRRAPTPEQSRPIAQSNIHSSPVMEDSVPVPSRRRHISELAAVRSMKDSRRLQSNAIRADQEGQGESRDPSEHESSGRMGVIYHQDEKDRSPRKSKSRDNRERAQNMVSTNGEDRQSRSRRGSGPESWPDYHTVISATKELKKLEKKIEKQLRTVRRETRNQDWENQSHVSSKEIRKLEKQLAQKLKRESEKRGAKLKRIKRRSNKKSTHLSEETHDNTLDVEQGQPPIAPKSGTATPVKSSRTTVETPASNSDIATKTFSQKVDDFRERSKFDQLRVLRSSRYLRPSSRGRNKPAPVSDHLAEGHFEI